MSKIINHLYRIQFFFSWHWISLCNIYSTVDLPTSMTIFANLDECTLSLNALRWNKYLNISHLSRKIHSLSPSKDGLFSGMGWARRKLACFCSETETRGGEQFILQCTCVHCSYFPWGIQLWTGNLLLACWVTNWGITWVHIPCQNGVQTICTCRILYTSIIPYTDKVFCAITGWLPYIIKQSSTLTDAPLTHVLNTDSNVQWT